MPVDVEVENLKLYKDATNDKLTPFSVFSTFIILITSKKSV